MGARARVFMYGVRVCVRALIEADTAGISVTRCVPRRGSSVGLYTSYGPEKGRLKVTVLYFQFLAAAPSRVSRNLVDGYFTLF